ncbi:MULTISPECIES: hypothetical protein [unclassified Ensifer]|uniref:hypothetical protein n=1 Tax=unclassified Ensifer TaxID=2633371 RepID=UPI0008134072|nr:MULTISPECIES: hypothetical protein [unclassified Ensifer]OCP01745.1 hypothetical protein BC362_21235 [Ensifer sp. LC14]OCP09534.1 hypothetical protein BC374_02975 [Ensifer sp. LC13]OCP10705.1 hypothetical protein BBX50_03315 [Ensifer sp. LC11]OCP32782.1 hypothetical protein BC364_02975 [Ensifer sp. LC499]
MAIKVAPHDPGKVSGITIVDALERAIGLASPDWTPQALGTLSRTRWAEVYYAIESLYGWVGGYEWDQKTFVPYRKNVHVPHIDFQANAIYFNTSSRTRESLVARIKKCLLFYDKIYFEEPISQLRFDHGFASVMAGKENSEVYRLYMDRWDFDGVPVFPSDIEERRKQFDQLIHYERIQYWVEFYAQIAPLIRTGIVVPICNHGDLFGRYLHTYDCLQSEYAFDKDDGFRNTEDIILSNAINHVYDRDRIEKLYRKHHRESAGNHIQLRYVELVLDELILKQLGPNVIPALDLSNGKVAFEILKDQLAAHHSAAFDDHVVEAQLVANHVPNPDAIDLRDLMAIRAEDEIFARWRACVAMAARRSRAVQSASQAETFSAEMRDTRLAWNADLDTYLSKSDNLSGVFKSLATKVVVAIFVASGVGAFSENPLASAAAGAASTIGYDALMTINDRLEKRKAKRQRFQLQRLYGAFDPEPQSGQRGDDRPPRARKRRT